MRPNVEEIRELANKATAGPWKLGREFGKSGWSNGLPNGSDVIVSWGTNWALGLDVAAVPYKNTWDGDFIAHSRTDIPALLAYIDELENMPLVQTVVKLQEENERLIGIISERATVISYCSSELKELRIEKEKDYQMNSDMALTLIEKSNEIERLRDALTRIESDSDSRRYSRASNWARAALNGGVFK